MEAVLLWSRSIGGLTARSRADAPESSAPLNANVRLTVGVRKLDLARSSQTQRRVSGEPILTARVWYHKQPGLNPEK